MKFHLNPPAISFNRETPWARQIGPFVKIPIPNSDHQLEHELVHVRQWWIITILSALVIYGITYITPNISLFALGLAPGVMGILTGVSAEFRFWSEAQAYSKSVKVSPHRFEEFAKMLYIEYGIGRSLDDCREAIK